MNAQIAFHYLWDGFHAGRRAEAGQDLSMLLRSHAPAHSSSPDADAAVRLPFPGGIGRAAGENFKTPRLPACPRPGGDETERELDYLFAPGEAICGTGNELKMPAGLCVMGSCFSKGPAASGAIAIELLRTGWRFRKTGDHLTLR